MAWKRRGGNGTMVKVENNQSGGKDSEDIDSKGNDCG